MDSVLPTLAGAIAGAAVGAVGTWLAQRSRDADARRRTRDDAIGDKLHQLELRIVRLEAESHAFAIQGQLRATETGGEAGA